MPRPMIMGTKRSCWRISPHTVIPSSTFSWLETKLICEWMEITTEQAFWNSVYTFYNVYCVTCMSWLEELYKTKRKNLRIHTVYNQTHHTCTHMPDNMPLVDATSDWVIMTQIRSTGMEIAINSLQGTLQHLGFIAVDDRRVQSFRITMAENCKAVCQAELSTS